MNKKFASFKDYSNFIKRNLTPLLQRYDKIENKVLISIGLRVQYDAKQLFGVYQHALGPYPAWQELAESTKQERVRLGYTPNEPLYRTGKLRESLESHVGKHQVSIGSFDIIMLYHEKGTSKIPPRPVLGPSMYRFKSKAGKLFVFSLHELFTGNKSNYFMLGR